jgi:hypothetical protein
MLAGFALLALAVAGGPGWAQKKDEAPTRSVKGVVADERERPLPGAVVQLKNTKTLQVKSFIADENGAYYFHGLDPNIDYQLKARFENVESRTRTLSTFDDRREVIYNFELKIGR